MTTCGKLINAPTAPHAQPTNATGLSNASQLASLKPAWIKVLIASLPANHHHHLASSRGSTISFLFLLAHAETFPSLVAVPYPFSSSIFHIQTETDSGASQRVTAGSNVCAALVDTITPISPTPFPLPLFLHPKHWKSTSGRRAATGRRSWGW